MMKNLLNILNLLFSLFPIKRNQLLFIDYYGAKYGDSPAYLSESIISSHPDWEIIWVFNQPNDFNIRCTQKVRYMTLKFFYHLATSKVLITNYRMPEFFKKRKGQHYIQTWHSSLRLKKIEKDAENSLTPEYLRMAQNDSKKIDLILSGCSFSSNTYRHSFWYNGEILECGTPRIDRLINCSQEFKLHVRKSLKINTNEKVVLYCPTFRQHEEDKIYYLDPIKFYNSLKEISPSTSWRLLVRYHPHELGTHPNFKGETGISDVTDYCDIQSLIAISDMMVTDYSGVMFDYAYTFKPCFLYVPDLEVYMKKERELYFDIMTLPFTICSNYKELINQINNLNEKIYKEDIEKFIQSIGSFEKGNACERITERIEKWIK